MTAAWQNGWLSDMTVQDLIDRLLSSPAYQNANAGQDDSATEVWVAQLGEPPMRVQAVQTTKIAGGGWSVVLVLQPERERSADNHV